MNKVKKLRIGGVPEHFNLPWRLAIDSGALEAIDTFASWQDFPGGTGSMVKALNNGTLDVAMLLTEGAIKGIEEGGDFEIISTYVQSPLIWGIHVPAGSNLRTLSDLENTEFAISRYGSGSHLMAYLLAAQQGWNIDTLSFNLIGDLDGAKTLFAQGGHAIFMWEQFMTQPMVDSGEFRRVGILPTPWPCFVVCARKSVLSGQRSKIEDSLSIVLKTAAELKASPIASKLIASRYVLDISETQTWLGLTQWATSINLDTTMLLRVRDSLKSLQLV